MTTLKDFDFALFCAYGADLWAQNYYSHMLVKCFNALDTDTKEKCRPLMENFRLFLRENAGKEYEEYLTSMSIK